MTQRIIDEVSRCQKKIDHIVHEIPILLDRLGVLLTPHVLNEMLYKEPNLPYFQSILAGDLGVLSPPAPKDGVTNETLFQKNSELAGLKDAAVELFVRVQQTLKWTVVVDLCMGSSSRSLFAERRESIDLLDIYCDHMLEQGEAKR